jgi:hypothetical protein
MQVGAAGRRLSSIADLPPQRNRNLRARIAVSSVVSSPSTCTAIGRAQPASVVAILDG